MKIIYLGSGEFGLPALQWLTSSDHDLLQIITQPARPAGRGKKLLPTPVARFAQTQQLPCREAPDIKDPAVIDHIRRLRPDLLLVIAFGQKVSSDLLVLPHCRAVNLHGSLLPAYRGAAPINWALINGEKQTGITVIELNEVWDAGDILGQTATDIKANETAGELHDRLALLGPALLGATLEKIAAHIDTPQAQDHTGASCAPKLCKTDAALCWNQPAEQLRNRINGMSPWPGAYALLQQSGKTNPLRVTFLRGELAGDTAPAAVEPGTLLDDFTLACAPGRLRPLQVKPQNAKLMTFNDFINGRRLQPGDRFLDG